MATKGTDDRMEVALTQEQVLALAPDTASAKAATGLTTDAKWVTLGSDDDAVWGECQGSGTKPYQAQVDLTALVSRCSCPSRKFPCKHGLALLLLYAQKNPRFANAGRPSWVDEWLASRRGRAEKKERTAEAASQAPVDPAAAAASAAKRESARWRRIEGGSAELQRWIADQFRRGLAKFGAEQRKDASAMAARMVDAQAPALARRIEDVLDAIAAGTSRHDEVIERFGLLQLINEGVRRRDTLSPARLADLRAALGWTPDKEEVLVTGEAVTDRWRVLGQVVVEADPKLTERRVWLYGLGGCRYALLQEFAYGGHRWERSWQPARHYHATLRYFPGSVPLRALAVEVAADTTPDRYDPTDTEAAFDKASQAYADNPWLLHVPLALDDATPFRAIDRWYLHTDVGTVSLDIDDDTAWSLLAFSGGHAVGIMGEWNGRALLPLSAWNSSQPHWESETRA